MPDARNAECCRYGGPALGFKLKRILGAYTITYTILECYLSYLQYNGPQNPILIIEAASMIRIGFWGPL